MSGISSKAAGKVENRFEYNGGNELQSGEFNDGSGLEMYDAVHRLYDPQLGRFGQIDKLAELGIDFTPYGFARNNPILLNDPLGLKEDTLNGTSPEVVVKSSKKQAASNQMNQMDYGQITGWIDGQRKKGATIETILNWALSNPYLNNNTLEKILDGTSKSALSIRNAQDEAWEAEGKLYKFFLESILLTAGGELLMLAEVGEGSAIASEVIGETTSASTEAINTVASTALKYVEGHVTTRMAERGITEKMIKVALRKGGRYFDPKNNAINYILKGGFGSGKDLLIGTVPTTGAIKTVIRGTNLISKRLIPLK